MSQAIKLNIFAKTKQSKEAGKTFKVYFTKLPNEDTNTRVKFRSELNLPNEFPCTITVEKGKVNLVNETYEKVNEETGEVTKETSPVIWVSEIASVSEYEDHSMDKYFN